MSDPLTITLLLFGTGLVAALLLAAAFGVDLSGLYHQIRSGKLPRATRIRLLLGVGAATALLWVVLFLHVLVTVFVLWWSPPETDVEGGPLAFRLHFIALVGLLTALAALVSFPLALERMRKTERQTRTAEQGHITDRINAAVRNLGEDKVVNRLGRTVRYTKNGQHLNYFEWQDAGEPLPLDADDDPDGKPLLAVEPWTTFPQSEPNLEVRIGAIHALARIARDSHDDHISIMKILCAYIRQNAPAPTGEDNPHHVFWGLVEPKDRSSPLSPQEAWEHPTFQKVKTYGSGPDDMTLLNMLNLWVVRLPPPRIDIQTALTVIGERSETQKALERDETGQPAYRLDLRNTNLRRADLSGLDLSNAEFSGAHLEGANLDEAHLEGAHLDRAHLEGARLDGAHLEGARLNGAHLEGAKLFWAHLERAKLFGAHLEGARLNGAHLEGARLDGAHLEGAFLYGAHLEGARLYGAHLDEKTSFAPATFRGAGARDVNLEHIRNETFTEAFGDASVTLPDGFTAGEGPLSHWPNENLDWKDFRKAWRAWQAEHHPNLLPPGYTPEA